MSKLIETVNIKRAKNAMEFISRYTKQVCTVGLSHQKLYWKKAVSAIKS